MSKSKKEKLEALFVIFTLLVFLFFMVWKGGLFGGLMYLWMAPLWFLWYCAMRPEDIHA